MNSETSFKMSLATARTLAVVKQGLHERPQAADKQALLDAIHRIGLLQIDTISVVARSQYLVMLSRIGPFDPTDLDALLYPDRRLFEGWAHAACLIPAEDYAHFAPAILACREHPLQPWLARRLGDKPQETLDTVLTEIRERGPLSSRDFEDPRDRRGTWWDWKPAKTALEILFTQGYLMVDRRVNFQRYYDLAERVLPASAEPRTHTVEDWKHWAALRSVSCLGVATATQVSDYYRQNKPVARAVLSDLEARGKVVSAEVEGWKNPAYLDPVDLPLVREIEAGAHQPKLTALLSPFDNLIWDRQRVRDLFGFDYRSEMYQPVAKRQYGYYVLPILHQGRLVGRLDPKADRKTRTLIVHAVYLEPDQPASDELVQGIVRALREFMSFHGSERLTIDHSEPKGLGKLLQDEVDQIS
jgi:uncharacterized protein YcaQ